MAAYDIQKHFKALRVDTDWRKRRPDPLATGFEDELDDPKRSRSRTESAASADSPAQPPPAKKSTPRTSSPYVRDSDDFLTRRSTSASSRRLSPGPPSKPPLPPKDPRPSRALAVGNLAYLDESEDDDHDDGPRRDDDDRPSSARRDRRASPAPSDTRKDTSVSPTSASFRRSGTPRGDRDNLQRGSSVPRHTVASPFAGTKYLQDSDSDSGDDDNDDAVSSRSGSQDSNPGDRQDPDPSDALTPLYSTNKLVKRVDKPKSTGSGVSWRAFSAGRNEQRTAELEALQANLQQRGKRISFGTHAVTDDGDRVPIGKPSANGNAGPQGRGRSPARPANLEGPGGDGGVDAVESYDPAHFKTNPFTG